MDVFRRFGAFLGIGSCADVLCGRLPRHLPRHIGFCLDMFAGMKHGGYVYAYIVLAVSISDVQVFLCHGDFSLDDVARPLRGWSTRAGLVCFKVQVTDVCIGVAPGLMCTVCVFCLVFFLYA